MNKKVILMILDGWGKSPDPAVSAVDQANIPLIKSLYKQYPSAELRTDGFHVGLPDGQMGNSEVGHMNLGAGRIIYQDLAKINLAVANNTLQSEQTLQKAFEYAKNNNANVHLLGLVSDGGVHSHTSHLRSLITATQNYGLEKVFVHAFTDGRDVDPKSGLAYLSELQKFTANTTAKIATVIGRYYAMDRDKRWERVKLAYDLMVNNLGTKTNDLLLEIQKSYHANITDEFIEPIVVTDADGNPVTKISDHDVVIFFNFRTDRGRELTEALSQTDFHEQNMHKLNLYYVTLTNYDSTYLNVHVVYNKDDITQTLGEILSKAGKKQIRIAETEKYPHVTFFFSGGRSEPFEGESRILCNSPKVATYDLQPEMSVYDVRDALVPALQKGEADFVCLNFANPDMVGHTGDFQAVVEACEAVDESLKEVVTASIASNYSVIVLADHGNADYMINDDGTPNTQHSLNLVPCILIDKDHKTIKNGKLGDIAPTILALMGIAKPAIMTGFNLLN